MSTTSIGSAQVTGSGTTSIAVRSDGPCLEQLTIRLRDGVGTKPLSQGSLDQLIDQATEFLSHIVSAYASDVALGEVGANGSATASGIPPLQGECPTGLLYGRIQSGKTAAMIVTTAMALDNGFRVIVVLTSNFEKLVEQTAARFQILDGPLIFASTQKSSTGYIWDDADHIRRHLSASGLVVVCAKNAAHQRALLAMLRAVDAPNYPCLILDDEADQATPDTTQAARTQQRGAAPPHGSVTYRLTVENDAATEVGESFREVLRHNVFVQVTATPYALLLQNVDHPLRPDFTCLLQPGPGYTGGEHFFADVSNPFPPPLVEVEESESEDLEGGITTAPLGLRRAIVFFLLSSAAHLLRHPLRDPTGYKLLCHTSPRTLEHDRLNRLIRDFVDTALEDDPELHNLWSWARLELQRSTADVPDLQTLKTTVARMIPHRRILTVNASGSALDFGPKLNFMVGGNILGRGLTIENLLVTYYLRRARTTQMDTMLQHARMYGYREQLMPFTRVFLPDTLAQRFHRIHDSETKLRALLADPNSRARVPVQVAGTLRPTRPGVLDVGSIAAYRPGQQVYPVEPMYRAQDLGNSTERISAMVISAIGEEFSNEFVQVPSGTITSLIESVRTHDQELGDWDQQAIIRVLKIISEDGYLYTRSAPRRKGPTLQSGVIGGDGPRSEQARARALNKPVLFMIKIAGAINMHWDGQPFWHPTVIFPSGMSNWVFNVSE